MQFFSFGINHHQVSLELRDRFAASEQDLKTLYRKTEVSDSAEYVVISTCNRTECLLYGEPSDVHKIQLALSEYAGEPWPLKAFLYQDEAAIMHIFEVTAGLNSLVVGDAQILGQVKDAYRIAVDEEQVGAVLHRLLHTAFSTAKRVVSETDLTSGTSSIAGTAVSIALHALHARRIALDDARWLVVGAGHMGHLVIDALQKVEGGQVRVANRSVERAKALKGHFPDVEMLPWHNLYEGIASADVVIVASGAQDYIINPEELVIRDEGKLTLMIDIAVPRNINPSVADVAGYHVFDLDSLKKQIDTVITHRKEAMPDARDICKEMLADFVSWCFHHQAMQPAIHAILDTFENIRQQEIERHVHRFVDADLKQLDRITKSIMQKVLAVPVVRLKNVGPDNIDYVNGIKLLQTLFARTSCEGPDLKQLNHSKLMLDAISHPEAASLASLAACPFDENESSVQTRTKNENVDRVLNLGTRGSALALWQANHVQSLLEKAGFEVEQEHITTRGDQILDKPLAQIEGKSLFTKELDVAIVDGRIDFAVHSLKDLPSELPEGLYLAAISPRENPFDAFVAHPDFEGNLEDLPEGAIIATSSLRRTAQLKAWRPDLNIVSVRGNIDTRLAKLDASDWHGIVLAAAGLIRMEWDERIHTLFDTSIMLPAVGQGALGIVCAEENMEVRTILHDTLHDAKTAAAVSSERAFLNYLEGSCHVPVGGFASWDNSGKLVLNGLVASLDGSIVIRGRELVDAEFPEKAGIVLAQRLLAEGADEILQLVKL